jgi:hypothetical protein
MRLEDWRIKFAGDDDVVSVEMHPTNLNNGTVYKKAVRINMRGGTSVAGCLWDGCVTVAAHPTAIVTAHWRTHTGEKYPERKRPEESARYSDLTLREISDALAEADAKVKRAEAARDRALVQLANMREANRDLIADLKAEVAAKEEELVRVKQAVKILYPGALG